jgi:hypothetical protein
VGVVGSSRSPMGPVTPGGRGLVASRCRSWGPSRSETGLLAEGQRATIRPRDAGFEPFEELPAASRTA